MYTMFMMQAHNMLYPKSTRKIYRSRLNKLYIVTFYLKESHKMLLHVILVKW